MFPPSVWSLCTAFSILSLFNECTSALPFNGAYGLSFVDTVRSVCVQR